MPQERNAGLSSDEARRRLALDGPNALPDAGRRRWPALLAAALREPMFALLLGAALLYLLLGEAREGAVLLAMVLLMLGMSLVQQGRTERALEAMRALGTPEATVWRDGRRQRLPAPQLVAGDVIEVAEGERVPADAWLADANGLCVDESLLTGESVAVSKQAAPVPAPDPAGAAPGGDGLPWLYSGTLVVQGHGRACVFATGPRSEIGRIGASLQALAPPLSRLQRATAAMVRTFALLGVGVSALLAALLLWRGEAPLAALLAGIALAMSLLPEEFPVILTVFPALGAWRLARSQVLTRRLNAIEILGATSVLCLDKTGTLTENRMAVAGLWSDGQLWPAGAAVLPSAAAQVLDVALRASRPHGADPIDQAIGRLAAQHAGAMPHAAGTALHEFGLQAGRPALVLAWPDGSGQIQLCAKGAPEAILRWCRLPEPAQAAALAEVARLAAQGLRVLAAARASCPAGAMPQDPSELPFEFAGLVALADPLRTGIPEAVAACRQAGVRLVMITGDHAATAQAIAQQAGFAPGATLCGPELAALDDAALAARLGSVAICARILPQQKLRIVRALQQGGAVVAMTGDGVNDAPALKAADVGVAMGKRGTDVAREAADLTLLDDRFASLVEALRAGRRIYGNMRKAMRYVLAMHVPIGGMALLPPLLDWPPLLSPLHIVLLELVIDPACALAFENEAEEPGLMRQPPRKAEAPLFDGSALARALGEGVWTLLLLVPFYAAALHALPPGQARGASFAAMVLCSLALLLVNRQDGSLRQALTAPNRVFWLLAGSTVAILAAVLTLPAPASVLGFTAPPPLWLAMSAACGAACASGIVLGRMLGAAFPWWRWVS